MCPTLYMDMALKGQVGVRHLAQWNTCGPWTLGIQNLCDKSDMLATSTILLSFDSNLHILKMAAK